MESDIIKQIKNLQKEIDNRFKYFYRLFLDNYQGKISKEEMATSMREYLNSFNDEELIEYNEMWKMFSTTNCGWQQYETAQLVHREILKILHPEDEE